MAAHEQVLRIRFARWLAGVLLALSAPPALGGVVLCLREEYEAGVPTLAAGLALAFFGVMYLVGMPYVLVTGTAVTVPVVRGGAGRTRIGRRDRLDLSGPRLAVIRAGGRRELLPVYRRMAHPGDWAALAELTAPEDPADPA